eukprot:3032110-Amphidinium_carterae.2
MAETAASVNGLSNLEWLIVWRKWVDDGRQPMSSSSSLVLAAVNLKSLYNVIRGANIDGVERRAGLESMLARDLLESLSVLIRWISHESNPAGSITKISATTLQISLIRLWPESDVLKERKEYRGETSNITRGQRSR